MNDFICLVSKHHRMQLIAIEYTRIRITQGISYNRCDPACSSLSRADAEILIKLSLNHKLNPNLNINVSQDRSTDDADRRRRDTPDTPTKPYNSIVARKEIYDICCGLLRIAIAPLLATRFLFRETCILFCLVPNSVRLIIYTHFWYTLHLVFAYNYIISQLMEKQVYTKVLTHKQMHPFM